MTRRDADLARIGEALDRARAILARYTAGEVEHLLKSGGDPVTAADTEVDAALSRTLPTGDDGWLSEETVDSPERLDRERVWIVDPLDGTREFVAGIPEWCVSVGLVENGRPVAGGICIPPRDLTILGAVGHGVSVNGQSVRPRSRSTLEEAEILASRSEVRRGEWERFAGAPFRVKPMGSVAAKLGLVAAGLADATWTLVPKHEWDVAAGVALVLAAGGDAWLPDGDEPSFNRRNPKLPGLLAAPRGLAPAIRAFFRDADIP